MVTGPNSGTFGSSRMHRLSDAVETSPTTDPLPNDEAEQPQSTRETAAKINRHEKGDLLTKDQHTWVDTQGTVSVAAQIAADKRMTIAREISAAIKRAVASHASIKLATSLQLLKRELARGHDILEHLKSEQDYLSIIVLAELALGETDWKQLSKDRLMLIKKVIEIGESQKVITYDDYNHAFRLLNAQGYLAGPVLDTVDDCNTIADE